MVRHKNLDWKWKKQPKNLERPWECIQIFSFSSSDEQGDFPTGDTRPPVCLRAWVLPWKGHAEPTAHLWHNLESDLQFKEITLWSRLLLLSVCIPSPNNALLSSSPWSDSGKPDATPCVQALLHTHTHAQQHHVEKYWPLHRHLLHVPLFQLKHTDSCRHELCCRWELRVYQEVSQGHCSKADVTE